MKLDLDYLRLILQTIEDHEFSQMNSFLLLQKLELPIQCTSTVDCDNPRHNEFDKFIKHIQNLLDLGSISGKPGFAINHNNSITFVLTNYCLTIEGTKLLESMKNDTLWNKIKSNLQVISFETLKTMPALALQLLLKIK